MSALRADIGAIPGRVEAAVDAGDEQGVTTATSSLTILERKLERAVEAARSATFDRVSAQQAVLQAQFDGDAELAGSYVLASEAYASAARLVRENRLRPAERRIAQLAAERSRLATR